MLIHHSSAKKQGVLNEPGLTQTNPSETVKQEEERVRNVKDQSAETCKVSK
ncbi:MAG: hypothetical protein WAM14_02135 [Candidatus Nitrosopolaris sp.]